MPTDLLSLVVIKLSLNVKETEAGNTTFLDCATEGGDIPHNLIRLTNISCNYLLSGSRYCVMSTPMVPLSLLI